MKKYFEIETKTGIINISLRGIRFATFEKLNEVKQAWRDSPNWHPVKNLFEIM